MGTGHATQSAAYQASHLSAICINLQRLLFGIVGKLKYFIYIMSMCVHIQYIFLFLCKTHRENPQGLLPQTVAALDFKGCT